MRLSWNGEAAETRGGIVHGNRLLHFLDFSFYFFCPLGIELIFIGGKLLEQSQKLSNVYKFLVSYGLEQDLSTSTASLLSVDSASCMYN